MNIESKLSSNTITVPPHTLSSEQRHSIEDSDSKQAPLDVLFEAAGERGQRLTLKTFACSDRMLNALRRLQNDKDNYYIALDVAASISMRVIGDAQTLTKLVASDQLKPNAALILLRELSNFAVIFARSETYSGVYDSICTAITELRVRLGERLKQA
jgi:hypothetical protein